MGFVLIVFLIIFAWMAYEIVTAPVRKDEE